MSSLRAKIVSFAFIFQNQEPCYLTIKISRARLKDIDEVQAQEKQQYWKVGEGGRGGCDQREISEFEILQTKQSE